MSRCLVALLLSTFTLLGAGCDQLGIESASAVATRKEGDGKAIGGACRHAGRAIEDCYTLNKRADKSSVYAGWREMNEYMRESKTEPVAPLLGTEAVVSAKPGEVAEAGLAKPATDKPTAKGKKLAS